MSGRRASAKAREEMPDWKALSFCGVRLGALVEAWESGKSFFVPANRAEAESFAASGNDARLGVAAIVLGGLAIFVIGVLYSLESVYVGNLLLETLSDVTGTAQPRFDIAVLAPSAAFQFLLYAVLGTIITIAYEGVAFLLFRLSGGSGTLARQLHAGGVIWLAAAISLGASLLLPLPCLQWIGVASMAALTLVYTLLFMGARINSRVHDVSAVHSGIIVLLLIGPRLAIWIVATDVLAGLTGISPMIQAGA